MDDFDYEYDLGKSMISDFAASIVFLVLSIIITIVFVITSLIQGMDLQLFRGLLVLCSFFILATACVVLFEGIKKKVKERKQNTSQ